MKTPALVGDEGGHAAVAQPSQQSPASSQHEAAVSQQGCEANAVVPKVDSIKRANKEAMYFIALSLVGVAYDT
ncbi:MAG: hypothetical protein FJX11_09570 [Alphaproteobacteria bacterium]|nr:hypothetical protein [Alphaproteobacteria bacterium]